MCSHSQGLMETETDKEVALHQFFISRGLSDMRKSLFEICFFYLASKPVVTEEKTAVITLRFVQFILAVKNIIMPYC